MARFPAKATFRAKDDKPSLRLSRDGSVFPSSVHAIPQGFKMLRKHLRRLWCLALSLQRKPPAWFMGKSNFTADARKLVGQLQLVRFQLTRAESRLDGAKEQARLAKRRRKEAKQAARRAKQEVKRARADLAEAKQAMAEAEAKLARAGEGAARKRVKVRLGARAQGARCRPKKTSRVARRRRGVRTLRSTRSAGRAAAPGGASERPFASAAPGPAPQDSRSGALNNASQL